MATDETGFDDVTFDLISLQYHSLKDGHDYGQYVRDARNAGQDKMAEFLESVQNEDAECAHQCQQFLIRLGGTDNTSRASQPACCMVEVACAGSTVWRRPGRPLSPTVLGSGARRSG